MVDLPSVSSVKDDREKIAKSLSDEQTENPQTIIDSVPIVEPFAWPTNLKFVATSKSTDSAGKGFNSVHIYKEMKLDWRTYTAYVKVALQ